MKNNPFMKLLKENYDLFYLGAAITVLVLDFLTGSDFVEGLAFGLVFTGFIFSIVPKRGEGKDERIGTIRLYAGYFTFIFSFITVSLFSAGGRYLNLVMTLPDTLRYIQEFTFVYFSLFYAVLKRYM